MSDMLSIGASGLRAYQVALNTVSENIANAGSAGYSRRVAASSEVAATGRNNTVNGLGSLVGGITRISDMYRAAEVRSTGSDLARTSTSVVWLQRIESSLSGSQLSSRISTFFNAATTLAGDPTSIGARSSMLEAASGVASAFSDTGDALDQIALDLDGTGRTSVETLNTTAAALAKVNSGLTRVQPGTSGQAALLDQRDQLLEQMSAITDVSVQFDGIGRATVHGGGNNGPLLVEGAQAAVVIYQSSPSGTVAFNVINGATLTALQPAGGVLSGVVDSMQRVVDARTSLSTLAQNFTTSVNTVQAAGRDLDANPGAAMFALVPGGTARMTMTLDDPRGIAAAAVGGGQRDNTNLAALAAARTTGNFEGKVVDLTTANAATLAQRKSVADAQGTIHDNAVASRDAESGVDMDSEAVDLMRFQQAYSATSRVIAVSREILQSILDIR